MLYMGVDLGKRKSAIAVVSEKGELHSECKLVNRKEGFEKFIRGLGEPVEVVCETGNKSFWLAEMMRDMDVSAHVANAYKVKLIAEARIKTDKIDAKTLAELLRVNFIPEVYVPSSDIRTWREVLRGRSHLVRMRVELYNRIHAILDRYGIEYEASQIHLKGAAGWIETLELPQPIKDAINEYLESVNHISMQVKVFEDTLKEKVKLDDEVKPIVELLKTIPGIGWLSSLALYLEIADISRFANVKKLWSYIGIIPGVHQSGDTQRGGRLTKQGNSFIRWLIVEDAWIAIMHDGFYRGLYERHKKRIGKSRAILPVARALLYAVYRVWSEGRTYEEIFMNKSEGQRASNLGSGLIKAPVSE